MSIALYMDEHIPGAITRAMRRRGASVITAQEDGFSNTPDPKVLDRATILKRVVWRIYAAVLFPLACLIFFAWRANVVLGPS